MQKIRFRAVEPEDTDLMFSIENDEESLKYSDYVAPLSRAMLRDYAENYDADPFKSGQLRLVIENENNKPVGLLDLYGISLLDSKGFVGIYILPEYRNRGIAKNALINLDKYIRNSLCLNQIVAKIPVGNISSEKLFRSAGYIHTATLCNWHRIGMKLSDIMIFQKQL